MRWSRTFIHTLKEVPEGAEIPSHVLILRASLVDQVMAGVYTYLPLGLKALQKTEQVIREEMNAAGAVELLMPAMSPFHLWEKTGRSKAFGNVLVHFNMVRQNREVHVTLGPTHEEVITDLVARHIASYRQLPITLYQIQTKFRNEERPRFGTLRTAEFVMKDAYSFDTSIEGLNKSYDKMYRAYCRIFERLCLDYLPVEAESGPIGGDASHEFMVPAENGEDRIVHCAECGYAANLEKAEVGPRSGEESDVELKNLEIVDTPNVGSIESVCRLLGCAPEQMIKTLVYLADGKPIVVLIRGDHEANENKIRRAAGAQEIELADPETIEKVTGAPVGFAGPVGLKESVPIFADYDVRAVRNGITGANKADAHYKGVNFDRDYRVDTFADLRCAVDGDACPRCHSTMRIRKAIEIGHVFKLGTKYSEALNARFLDADEKLHPMIMGCYGIGVGRTIATLIETSYDENGIVWPVIVAPYEVVIAPIKAGDETLMQAAEKLHDAFEQRGIDVLLDDRDVRAGVKFKDADLIGFPLRIVVGDRGLKEGKVEVKWRWESESQMLPIDDAVDTITEWLADERKTGKRFREAMATRRAAQRKK
ncbi:proline--tRNA ligase [Thermostilla marina]